MPLLCGHRRDPRILVTKVCGRFRHLLSFRQWNEKTTCRGGFHNRLLTVRAGIEAIPLRVVSYRKHNLSTGCCQILEVMVNDPIAKARGLTLTDGWSRSMCDLTYTHLSDLTAGGLTAARRLDKTSSREVAETKFLTLKILRRERFLPYNLLPSVLKLQGTNRVSEGFTVLSECLARHGGRPQCIVPHLRLERKDKALSLPIPEGRGLSRRFR